MIGTSKAASTRERSTNFTRLRLPFGIAAALLAVLALALPSLASADPLGEATFYKSGLRATALVRDVTPGPDGNVWFVDNKNLVGSGIPAIGLITPSGEIKEYISGTNLSGLNPESDPNLIVAGPGASKYLWFTDRGSTPAIGLIDSTSPETATEFCEECSKAVSGLNVGSKPTDIAVGPEGNLWFTDAGSTKAIGVAVLSSENEIEKIEEFPLEINPESRPQGIVAGPDGNLWFTDTGTTAAVGMIDPSTHAIEEFPTGEKSRPGGGVPEFGPFGIVAGPDGNVWFTDAGNGEGTGQEAICRMLTSGEVGKVECFDEDLVASSEPTGLTVAPGGKLWFTDSSGVNEKQEVKFEGTWANGNKFTLCNEAETSCAEGEYNTATGTLRTKVKNALNAVYGAGAVPLNPSCSGAESSRHCSWTFSFPAGPLSATDVGQTGCASLGEPCSTGTLVEGVSNAVGCMTTAGEACGRYPFAELYGDVGGITYMPGGNVWLAGGKGEEFGFSSSSVIGKLGVEPPLNLKVTKTGTGTGTVTSSPSGINCGSECEEEFASGTEVTLTATPDEGSALTSWSGCTSESEGKCIVNVSGFNEIEVSAEFGPTSNRRTLTIAKSGNGPGGLGSISSKPKGIKCGANCNKAVASMYLETPVVLTEKPGKNSTFVEWTGDCSGSSPTCTLPMAEDESVGAVFSTGTSEKVLSPAEALTVSKGESTGYGTVKGTGGLGCEAECTETVVLYQGPVLLPHPKPGKLVTLKQAPAFGSAFAGWSGCDSEPVVEGSTQCVVEMDEAHLVTAEYTALPNKVLTVNKPYATGNGSVASKPKGIKCAAACTQAVAQMPQGASIELIAKPGKETTFVHWVGGDCNGETTLTCTVTMNANETTEAVFSKGGKAFLEGAEETLTLTKAGKGSGTVKATGGLACEVLCSSTDVVYQGPVLLPHPKPGKLVTLKATSAPGSKPVQWTGCDTEPVVEAEVQCVVAMEASREVIAKFGELE